MCAEIMIWKTESQTQQDTAPAPIKGDRKGVQSGHDYQLDMV